MTSPLSRARILLLRADEMTIERPIIFSGAMVRAILDGRKTMTRRKLNPSRATIATNAAPGARLWVREAWRTTDSLDRLSPNAIAKKCAEAGYLGPWAPMLYLADNAVMNWETGEPGRRRASMHMPRWASRITLEVTAVKSERLQDISCDDCSAEGVTCPIHGAVRHTACSGLRSAFLMLWTDLHGPGSWEANPEVVAIGFRMVDKADNA